MLEVTTPRLKLRPFQPEDAPQVQILAGDADVALMTASIPHPYPPGAAAEWIATHEARWREGSALILAIIERSSGLLVGSIALEVNREQRRGELGYWIGKPYWGRGYATEAGAGMLDAAFASLGLTRVYAAYFPRNGASGAVMRKLGMLREGCLRQHVVVRDVSEDVELYSILRHEWETARRRPPDTLHA